MLINHCNVPFACCAVSVDLNVNVIMLFLELAKCRLLFVYLLYAVTSAVYV